MRRSTWLLAALLVIGSYAPASAQDKKQEAHSEETQSSQPMRDWTVIHHVAGDNDADQAYAETLKPLSGTGTSCSRAGTVSVPTSRTCPTDNRRGPEKGA